MILVPKERLSFRRSCVEFNYSRPFGTDYFPALNPTLKRWATLRCPSGTTDILANKRLQSCPHLEKGRRWARLGQSSSVVPAR